MKRVLNWIALSLVTLLLLVLIGVGFYSRTEQFSTWLRTQALTALQASVNGEVTLQQISGSLWSGIVLHNFSIRQNGVDVLSVPQAVIAFHLLPQLLAFFQSSTIRFDQLTLMAPVLKLVQEPQTGWNIAHLFKTAEQDADSTPLSLYFSRIEIRDGQFAIQPLTGAAAHLTAFSTDGSVAVLPSGMKVNLRTLRFRLTREGIPEVQWNGGIAYDATQSPPVLTLQPVDLRTSESQLQMAGTVRDFSAPTLALTANVMRLAVADVRRLAPAVPLQQDLSGTVEVTGPLAAVRVVATVQAPDGQVSTDLLVDLMQSPAHYQGTLTVKQLVINKVAQLADVSGTISGHVSFTGTLDQLRQGDLQAQASQLVIRNRAVGDATVTGTIVDNRATLAGTTRGALGDARWQSQFTVTKPITYTVTLAVRNLDVARVVQKATLPAAILNFDARLEGRGIDLKEGESAITFTLLPSRLGEVTDAHGQITATLHHDQLSLNAVSLEAKETTLTGQGKLTNLQATPHATVTYALQSKEVAPWLTLIGQEGAGAVALQGTASGVLTSFQVEGNGTVSQLRLASSSVQTGALTYALAGIGSPQANGQLTAMLTDMQAGILWRTATLDLTLSALQPLGGVVSFVGQDTALRTHRLRTQFRYTPERVEAQVQELALQLPTGTWRTPQPAQLSVQNKVVTIENFRLQRGAHALSAQGTFAFQGAQSLHLEVDRLSLAEVRSLLATGPEVSGEVSAEVQIHGTAAQPELDATLTTSALTVAKQSYAGLSARATYQQPQLQLDALLRQDATHTLSVDGSIPLALQWAGESPTAVFGDVDLRVRSAGLSLAFLSLLSQDLQEVHGVLKADVQVHGPLRAPVPSGSVQLEQGGFMVKRAGLALQDITVGAQLSESAIELSQFSLRSGDGNLTGSGNFTLQQYTVTAFDLVLNANRLRVSNTPQSQAAVSGRLTGSGSFQQPALRGVLELVDTTLRPDLSLLRSGPAPPDPTITVVNNVAELSAPALSTPAAAGEPRQTEEGFSFPLYERLTIDVKVTITRDTWIYVDEGSVEFRGQVQVRKNPQTPVAFVGLIETVRGWYNFHGRKFQFERGEVRFTGETPIDPSLDIVARYALPEYRVEIVVGGTAQTPTLALRSDPVLEQADILSLLIFGKPTSALNASEKTSLESQALQTAAGYVAGDLQRALAGQLGLDNLELDVSKTLDQSSVGAGKYLTQDVYVSTSRPVESSSQQAGDKLGQEFSLEYYLNENWKLKGSTTTRGNNGIDILWQKRY